MDNKEYFIVIVYDNGLADIEIAAKSQDDARQAIDSIFTNLSIVNHAVSRYVRIVNKDDNPEVVNLENVQNAYVSIEEF